MQTAGRILSDLVHDSNEMPDSSVTYTQLGSTGLEVSRLCLGSMNFGSEAEWMMNDREASIELIQQAIDAGINFIDTANTYSNGESEEIVGEAVSTYDREQLVLATKVFFPAVDEPGPNQQGLSRKHIFEQIENSLANLGTDYVDLYQIHRWDENTPIEETLSALDALVDAGKVRYIGASTMASWRLMDALKTSDIENYDRFVSVQPEYSLIKRHEEENLLPVAGEQDLGVITWSPLAGGFLSGKYTREEAPEGSRLSKEGVSPSEAFSAGEWSVLDELRAIARDHDATPAQISLAWQLNKDIVTAPIIGPRTPDHLETALGAHDISLSAGEIERLEAPIDPSWSREFT